MPIDFRHSSLVTLDSNQTINGIKTFTNTLRGVSGTIGTELASMWRILGGAPATMLTTPKHGLGIKLYNNTTQVADTDVVYGSVIATHHGGPDGVNKTWGFSSSVFNESTTALSTVGYFASVRNSGGTPTWGAALEVWDSFNPGSGLVQSNANLVCMELLNLHSGSGTSYGLTVIGGGANAGTRGIWIQPGNSVNGTAGWNIGLGIDIGPNDTDSIGIQFKKAPDGYPSGTAWQFIQALNSSANEIFSIDSLGVPQITNWTPGTNAGLLKFYRSGVLKAQTGLNGSDQWTSFSSGGSAILSLDASPADGETAIVVRRNIGAVFTQVPLKFGADGTGPGGTGRAVYVEA